MESKNNKTILVVEDEVILRRAIVEVLKEEGFAAIEAENGKEGLEAALKFHPDLILLDLLMPVMAGMEALKEIRKDAWGANVPVIILTVLSATDEKLVEDMVTERPVFYLVKSDWKIHDVVLKIKECLQMGN